jgi:dCMP deaminase
MIHRPKWDETWMDMAYVISRRSVDPAYKVGCIVVSDDNQRIMSSGYNAMERGGPNEVASLERGMSETVHAEMNALIKLNFDSTCRRRMYVTLSPCRACARAIVNAGIDEVIYDDVYRGNNCGLAILRARGIVVRQFSR